MSPETHDGHPWDEPGFEYRSTTTPETLAGTLAAATSAVSRRPACFPTCKPPTDGPAG